MRDAAALRAISLGNFMSWGLSLVVTVMGVASGLAGTLAWSLAVTAVVATGRVAGCDAQRGSSLDRSYLGINALSAGSVNRWSYMPTC